MPLPDERPTLSDAELHVLKILWREGPSAAGQVRALVNEGDREWAYTTTKTILDRLEDKGYVSRSRQKVPHVFSATVSPDALARSRIAKLAEDVFGGSELPLVRALLGSVRLSSDDIAELRASLDELEAGRGDDD